ncbi:ferrous iron transport protein B [Streptococcaceae bacterium ESL0729]|nr:ferrous iron transport protein B [Streptococcaceae bacterium ESL0729]
MTTIALAGNPNSGKTSVFNILTGSSQRVGNWPGVTVDKKSGTYKKDKVTQIQDLPGIYSLSPYTPEEIVSRDYLLKDRPDAILNIVDATNLERNLYLTLQLLETEIPLVLGLNMMDALKREKKEIDLEKLSYGLGVKVVPMTAIKGRGVFEALEVSKKAEACESSLTYDARLESSLAELDLILGDLLPLKGRKWYLIKIFEGDQELIESLKLTREQGEEIAEIIAITEKIFQEDAESIVINERYALINQITELATSNKSDDIRFNLSDKIDKFVTNRFLGLPIFALVMWGVYYLSIQTVGTMGTDWINDNLFGEIIPSHLEAFMGYLQIADWLQDLVLNGIVAGIGAVLGFLPQIAVLFLCLGLLEDCGYMSRVAFVMDRIFRNFGLSGKSFIPMLISTGCGVPGIMASRTIESESDRRITIMVTTFMPCSAKLPIIALIAGAFFPSASWVAPSAYFLGMLMIILSGILLKKTKMLSGKSAPFIMELPNYHFPRIKSVLQYSFERSLSFVKRAGTIIFVMNIIIWFTSSYNWHFEASEENESILASLGSIFSPLFAPLGWGNWQATVATITGLVAKETVVGTLGVLYTGAKETSENGQEYWVAMREQFTPLAAYSFLAFNLLCAPCFAAIGAIYREMGDMKWTLRAIFYQTCLAYLTSFVIYQVGTSLLVGHLTGGVVLALLIIVVFIYLLVRKPKYFGGTPSLEGVR